MQNLGDIARLTAETRPYHSDNDAELDRLLAAPSADAYRAWLLRQHGFLAPLEAALESTPRLADVIELRARCKVPRLVNDLLALGVSRSELAAAPTCSAVPATFTRVSVALGWLCTVERSILQYGAASRRLARALPGAGAFASPYRKCSGGSIGQMWRAFAAAVDLACSRGEEAAELAQGAHDAYRCLRRWQQR